VTTRAQNNDGRRRGNTSTPRRRCPAPPEARRLPKDVYSESLSRFPLLTREDMDAQGQTLYDAVVSPQSRTLVGLQGPGGISLHSPRLAEHVRAANQYLRYETTLERRLTELAILVTARELDHQFEWTAHEPAALKEGLDPKIIDLVKHRKPIARLGKKEAVIVRFGRELFREKKLRSKTFAQAVQLFGRQGVLNLAALMGNYAMTAIILNMANQQLHPDQKPLLPIP
jgi:4-carboxymuconolactone decarboxylase